MRDRLGQRESAMLPRSANDPRARPTAIDPVKPFFEFPRVRASPEAATFPLSSRAVAAKSNDAPTAQPEDVRAVNTTPIPPELQRQALEAAQLLVREFSGTILHWTHGMERLYGWTREEAVGRSSHDLLQTDFPRPLADIESELIELHAWSGELLNRRRDGERVVAASHWSLWDDGAPGVRRVVEVDNDVTRERRDHETQQYLANIVQSADDAIIGKTLGGIITSWNKSAEAIFGYAPDEIIGKSITLLFPPDRLNEEVSIIEQIGKGGRVDHFETVRRRKDGSNVPVSLTISPILGPDGRIIGASKIVRDISEREQAQIRLQEVQTDLFHLSRLNTVSHMASGLAHELNQPLSAISNYLRGAQRLLGDRTDELSISLKYALEQANRQAVRAGEVVKRLRNFLARGEPERRPESLSELIRETNQLALLGNRGATVVVELDAAVDIVLIDRIQIQQVLLNLVRNALEAMDRTERRELRIASRPADTEMAEISVMDLGSGIPEEVASQMFKPFVSTKGQGMGVGLAISKTIVESHGGRITVEPNPEGGTIFRFTVPLAPEADE